MNSIKINLAQLITGLDLSDDCPYLKMGLELVLREKELCQHEGRET
jgi:hypothetical protein